MDHQNYLDLAAKIASKIDPKKVHPNPRVGCVIVRNGEVVASGVHERLGENHAERNAIKELTENSDLGSKNLGKGLEVYVSLEPCDDFDGKLTLSCTELLKSLKPDKVFVGSKDPKFNGDNLKQLTEEGILTQYIANKNCEKLNKHWFLWKKRKKPFIHLKFAQTLDGKIFSQHFPLQISNETSHKKVHDFRANVSAILTTTETVLLDNPYLNVREQVYSSQKHPDLIILGQRTIPNIAKIFESPGRDVFCFKDLNEFVASNKYREIPLILTECGAQMMTELLDQDLVDRISLFTAPKFFTHGKDAFSEEIPDFAENFQLQTAIKLVNDVYLDYLRK